MSLHEWFFFFLFWLDDLRNEKNVSNFQLFRKKSLISQSSYFPVFQVPVSNMLADGMLWLNFYFTANDSWEIVSNNLWARLEMKMANCLWRHCLSVECILHWLIAFRTFDSHKRNKTGLIVTGATEWVKWEWLKRNWLSIEIGAGLVLLDFEFCRQKKFSSKRLRLRSEGKLKK